MTDQQNTDITVDSMNDQALDMVSPPRSQWWDVWRQFKAHRGAMWGMGFFIFILLFVVFGP